MRRAVIAVAGLTGAIACAELDVEWADATVPFPREFPFPTPISAGDGKDGSLLLGDTAIARTNTCNVLIFGAGRRLELATTDGVFPGRRLLVWQVQASFATSGDQTPIATASSAGFWILTAATSVSADEVEIADLLPRTFRTDATHRAQACTVPEFTDVRVPVGARIDAFTYDAGANGLIGFFAHRLELNGEIFADGDGFLGAPGSKNDITNTSTLEDTDPNSGARKGYGHDIFTSLFGRGNRANGGGGGNAFNAGGGGGGNGGQGGEGGIECCDAGADPDTGGRGGARIAASSDVFLSLGGSGGSGHSDTTQGPDGGDGGGLVLLIVGTFAGAGVVRADGDAGGSIAENGAGGGGAGGTIRIDALASTFTGTLSARGGPGGNVTDGDTNPAVHGPGGGGGGGRVRVRGVPGAAIVVSGGASGTDDGDPRGATSGGAGVIE